MDSWCLLCSGAEGIEDKGNIHNFPLRINLNGGSGPTRQEWRQAVRDMVAAASKFEPDIVIVHLGLDGLETDLAHVVDNKGRSHLLIEDFDWFGEEVTKAFEKVVAVLEGGYDIRGWMVSHFALAFSAFVRRLIAAAQPFSASPEPASTST